MDGHEPEETASPLDPEAFSKLKQLRKTQKPGAPDIVVKIINLFLDETPKRLDDARNAIREESSSRLELAVHSIKGSCAVLGLPDIADVCQQIEHASRSGQMEPVRHQLDHLEEMLADARYWLIKERDHG